jgi:hypothetical protein
MTASSSDSSGVGASAEAGAGDDVGYGDPNCGEAFLYE